MTYQPWEVAPCEVCGVEGLAARTEPKAGPYVCEGCELYARGREDGAEEAARVNGMVERAKRERAEALAEEAEGVISCPLGPACGFGTRFDELRAERARGLGLALAPTEHGSAILQAVANEAVAQALGRPLASEPRTTLDGLPVEPGDEAEASPTGRKDDAEKRRWELLPWRATGLVVDVLTFGARKYAPENWRKVPEARRRYYAAAIRHLTLWWLGERLDAESGLPHLACAACDVLFLLDLEDDGTLR